MESLAFEIGIVIIASALTGLILHQLKQPLILAYIIAGILIGPFGLGLIQDPKFIHGIATIGIMFMLFLVGLEMNTSRLKDMGPIALVTGIGQIMFTGIIGFSIIRMFDFTMIQSVYLAVALTFSSTVIAVKLMSDKKDTKSLYGQICIGILIVQDILAIIALLLLAGFKQNSFGFDFMHFGGVFTKGILLTITVILVSKYILKYLYGKIATSRELLILFSLSWCFLVALISMKIGFSMEIGAFVAGISLANLPYAFEINTKAKVLRDFFITIFFAALGTGMIFSSIGSLILPLIVLSLFVLIGNPIIVLFIMGRMGYDKRTAFFVGLNIANISEFSLIVIALGSKLGHLGEKITSMAAIIAMTTMVISSYMITYNKQLYRIFKKHLSIFEKKNKNKLSSKSESLSNHIILIGCGQMGEQVLEQILSFKDDYIIVDHDTQVIKKLMKKNINCLFGDVESEELIAELDIEHAEVIISTLPKSEDNYFLLQYLKNMDQKKKPIVIAAANTGREGMEMSKRGVDYVVLRHYLLAHHIHYINKEIYQIREELRHVPVLKNIIQKTNFSDNELAQMVHEQNKFRLKNLKSKVNLTKTINSAESFMK
jgi:Kef-type K+ transport system membrane component KefB/Trk K+ transport system NAD-binding subunit